MARRETTGKVGPAEGRPALGRGTAHPSSLLGFRNRPRVKWSAPERATTRARLTPRADFSPGATCRPSRLCLSSFTLNNFFQI